MERGNDGGKKERDAEKEEKMVENTSGEEMWTS